ncbi:MAG: immunoglobulin domain-containing protein [Phycisphaerae bacterium]|nr:immunoglobulin domain-containing protein [Phycisphaerae bacterium]
MYRKRVTWRPGFASLLLLTFIEPGWAQLSREVAPTRQFTWKGLLDQETVAGPQPDAVVPREAPDHRRAQARKVPSPSLRRAGEAVGEQSLLPAPEALCPGFPAQPTHNFGFGFQGLDDDNSAIPPDTIGGVGPRHVMTMLNTQVRIHNRNGAVTYSTVSLGTFWAGLSGPFDPKVYYDNLSGRWIAVCLGSKDSANSDWEIAISNANDPTGSWTSYHLDGDGANTRWVDFPCVGLNDKWVAVTFNAFAVTGVMPAPATGSKMWVFNKPELLAGGTVGFTEFDVDFDVDSGFCMQPAICMEPGVADLYILDSSSWTGDPNGNTNWLRLSRITGTAAAPAWSALPGSNTTNAGFFAVQNRFSNTLLPAAQRDSATGLDGGDSRMCNVVYRNGRIWAVHGGGYPADAPDRNALFWYELQPALPNPIIQSGIIQSGGPNAHYIYPSIGVNCGNDACIGFSSTSPAIYPSACYVTRRAGDPPGTTSSTQYFKDGLAKYVKIITTKNRWGDYSATVVDPLDDKTFWTLQEYAELPFVGGIDRWAVQWAQITRDCPVPGITQHPASQDICLGQPVTFSVGVDGVSVADYQWNKNGQPIVGATFYNHTIPSVTLADAGQYTCTVIGLCAATTSNPATLNVLTAPVVTGFVAWPNATCPGTNAVIIPAVPASGAFPMTVTLQKHDGVTWQDVLGRTISYGEAFSFTPLVHDDTGDYRLKYVNACGSGYTGQHRLQVGVSFDQQPAPQTKLPCESAAFNVIARGVGTLSYQWRHDGVNLVDDGRISGAGTPSLSIMKLRYEDEGLYDCAVTDSCETRPCNPALLTLSITPTWQLRSPATAPIIRSDCDMAYDSHRGVCVLYGGYYSTYLTDTWEWDGIEWVQRNPAHTPGRRSGHAMTYDSDLKRVVLYGGFQSEIGQPAWPSDLWAYDGDDWVQLVGPSDIPPRESPYPTTTPELTYDSTRKRIILVRNQQNTISSSETYEFDPATGQWSLTVPSNGFTAGYGGAIGYDPGRNQVVHYYGNGGLFGVPKETWRYNGTSWAPDPATTPQMPFCFMQYDSTRRRNVIFYANYGSLSLYTVSYFDLGMDWGLLLPNDAPDSPPAFRLFCQAMAYDSKRGAMVAVFADYYGAPNHPFITYEYRYLDRVVFDRHPQSQPLSPGGNVTLTVAAAGHGSLAYQWKRNGQNLVDGPAPGGGGFSGTTTPVLTLTGVQQADGGIYTCAVSNACGGALSNGALLGTAVPPDLDTDGDVDGDDLDLFEACASGPGVPRATGCEGRDFDNDGDVDQSDFALVHLCLSGDGIPADPNCAN